MADKNNHEHADVMTPDPMTVVWKDKKHYLWFPISATTYYIKNDRLMIKRGIFSTTLDETLLYRMMDLTFHQSLLGKIFGTGDIIIKTRVDAHPVIVLENISRPLDTRDLFSRLIEDSRRKYNVVGNEFYGNGGGHHHMDHDGDGICDFEELPPRD